MKSVTDEVLNQVTFQVYGQCRELISNTVWHQVHDHILTSNKIKIVQPFFWQIKKVFEQKCLTPLSK